MICYSANLRHMRIATARAREVRKIAVPLSRYMGEGGAELAESKEEEIGVFLELAMADIPDVMIDYSYIAEYSPENGFWLAVDSARQLHNNKWSSASHCLAPPANLYADPPMTGVASPPLPLLRQILLVPTCISDMN